MFEIVCKKCNTTASFKTGTNNEDQISISGQVEVLFDAEIYIECNCGNEITIEKEG